MYLNNRKKNKTAEITIWPQTIAIGEETLESKDDNLKARQYSCCNVTKTCGRLLVGILVLIAAFAVIGIVLAAFFTTEDVIANQRYIIQALSVSGMGSVTGQLELNTNSRQIVWDLITQNITLPFQTLSIHGPIGVDNTTAPPFVNICGPPTTLVCTLSGYIGQTNPTGLSLQQYIVEIRNRPFAYYLNMTTGINPNLEARAQLGLSSGLP